MKEHIRLLRSFVTKKMEEEKTSIIIIKKLQGAMRHHIIQGSMKVSPHQV